MERNSLLLPPEVSRVRRVISFADATGCPPEALPWLLRLSDAAEARHWPEIRDSLPAGLLPLLALEEENDRG